MIEEISAFRHDPRKTTLHVSEEHQDLFDWQSEPFLIGHRKFTHQSKQRNAEVAVPICASPIVVTGRGVIVGGYDGKVRFVDPALKTTFWTRQLSAPIYSSLIADPMRKLLYVATIKGDVACINLEGELIWEKSLGQPVLATMAIVPGQETLLVGAFNAHGFWLSSKTGEIKHECRLPEPRDIKCGSMSAFRDPYATPAITQEENVVFCCGESVICFSMSGVIQWTTVLKHSIRSSPASVSYHNQVVVGSVDGTVNFIDARTGAVVYNYALDAKITASPAVSGKRVAISTVSNRTYCFDSHSLVWESASLGPYDYTSFSVVPDGSFICLTPRGNIGCQDRETGKFLWETTQLFGLPIEPRMDITPISGPDGMIYCGSYSGNLYGFQARKRNDKLTKLSLK